MHIPYLPRQGDPVFVFGMLAVDWLLSSLRIVLFHIMCLAGGHVVKARGLTDLTPLVVCFCMKGYAMPPMCFVRVGTRS